MSYRLGPKFRNRSVAWWVAWALLFPVVISIVAVGVTGGLISDGCLWAVRKLTGAMGL